MYNEELDSFVSKFRHLWRIGCDAHLDINAHAGQAWLGLHVRLGHAPGPLHQDPTNHFNKSRNSPSRQRRRERRAAARKEAVAAQVTRTEGQDVASENTDTNIDIIEEVTETDVSREKLSDEVTQYESAEEAREKGEKDSEEHKNVEGKVSEKENELHEGKETSNATSANTSEHSETVVPPVVTIHATAVIDESPNSALTEEEFRSLGKIIQSKDHLVNNIENIEYSYLSTKEFRTKFKHTVGLVIFVKTCNLWEGARSYIWKHLGRDTWSLNNGSEVNFVRIHQK